MLTPARLGPLGDRTADGLRRFDVAGALQTLADLLLESRGSRNHLCSIGFGDLGVNVLRGAVDRQTGHAQLTNMRPRLDSATQSARCFLVAIHFFFSLFEG